MNYDSYFTRYGSPSNDMNETIYVYTQRAEKLSTVEEVAHCDKSAADKIAELQRYIDFLTEHRKRLTARYGELLTMGYTTELKLQRYCNYDNRKFYYLRTTLIYDDGSRTETETKRFPGTERHKAIAEFERLAKLHPDWKAIKDIAKGKWER